MKVFGPEIQVSTSRYDSKKQMPEIFGEESPLKKRNKFETRAVIPEANSK